MSAQKHVVPAEWSTWDDATRGAFIVAALTVQPTQSQFEALGRLVRKAETAAPIFAKGHRR